MSASSLRDTHDFFIGEPRKRQSEWRTETSFTQMMYPLRRSKHGIVVDSTLIAAPENNSHYIKKGLQKMNPWVSCWVTIALMLMQLFAARDADAFPTQNNCSSRKKHHSFTTTVVTPTDHEVNRQLLVGSLVRLYLFPTPNAVSRSCWSRPASITHITTNDQSVLATTDTLPNFSTAHGLLSPDVVMRIAESNDGLNGAVNQFLKTYLKSGPMACLSMLSDPQILPELTKAMRTIA